MDGSRLNRHRIGVEFVDVVADVLAGLQRLGREPIEAVGHLLDPFDFSFVVAS